MGKTKYYPCVWYCNNLHTLKSDGRYHNLSSSLRDVCYATYNRAKEEVLKQHRVISLDANTYRGLVLSSEDFNWLNDKVFENDEIYFDCDKQKAVYEYIKEKFIEL